MNAGRAKLSAASAMLLLLFGVTAFGATEVAGQAEHGPKLPPPAHGHARYVMVLWDPGTPVPGSDGKELMMDVPEPDLERLGGKLLRRNGQKRVLDLPPGKAKELRKHRSVMYLQRLWMGEPYEELAEERETSGAAAVASHSETGLAWGPKVYSYDPSGNIKEISKKDGNGNPISPDSYAYDTAGRLIQATVSGKTEQYEYDAYGNLTKKTLVGSTALSIPVEPSTNRVVGMEYDEAGNMLRRDSAPSPGGRYNYDAFNMLSSYDGWPNLQRYIYDADDERIGVITGEDRSKWAIRDFGGRVLREYEGEPMGDEAEWVWQQDYVYAGSQLVGGERMKWGYLSDRIGGVRHYHLDHLGSVRLVTDAHARLVAENDYYPYGATPTNSFQEQLNFRLFVDTARYAGHHRDFLTGAGLETGEYLDYMHARYYDPKLARFLSVDPKERREALKLPQGWNRYAYAHNNPLKYLDPDGEETKLAVGLQTDRNPIGHVAIIINDKVYSYGTNWSQRSQSQQDWGASSQVYLDSQAGHRQTQLLTLNITPEQEQKLQQHLDANNPNAPGAPGYNHLTNNCASVCQNAFVQTGTMPVMPVQGPGGLVMSTGPAVTPQDVVMYTTQTGMVTKTETVGTPSKAKWYERLWNAVRDTF